jgi:hypothetical protein
MAVCSTNLNVSANANQRCQIQLYEGADDWRYKEEQKR